MFEKTAKINNPQRIIVFGSHPVRFHAQGLSATLLPTLQVKPPNPVSRHSSRLPSRADVKHRNSAKVRFHTVHACVRASFWIMITRCATRMDGASLLWRLTGPSHAPLGTNTCIALSYEVCAADELLCSCRISTRNRSWDLLINRLSRRLSNLEHFRY